MNLHDKIADLPETVNEEILQHLFLQLIEECKIDSVSIKNKEYYAQLLCDLSDKQWHNYKLINQVNRDVIDSFVSELLAGDITIQLIEYLSTVIGNLGLTGSYQLLRLMAGNDYLNSRIKKTIIEVINEFGDSVKDPYEGLS